MKNNTHAIVICIGCIFTALGAPTTHKKTQPQEKPNEYVTHLVSMVIIAQDAIDGVHTNDFYTGAGAQPWLKNVQKRAIAITKQIDIKASDNPSPAQIAQDLATIVKHMHEHLAVTPLVEPDSSADKHAWNEFRRRATRLNVDNYCIYVLTHNASGTQSGLVCRAKKGPRLRGVFWVVNPLVVGQFDPTHVEKSVTAQPIIVKAQRMAFLENATAPDNTHKPGTSITRIAAILPALHQRVLADHIKHQKRREQHMHEQQARQQPHSPTQK